MTTASHAMDRQAAVLGGGAILFSQASLNLGAALGKHLFPVVGAEGVAALRVGLAAVLLLAILRPWRSPVGRGHVGSLLLYGTTMGMMSLFIYQAIARIPIGVATAIEVTGPLSIVLLNSRRPLDFLWLGAAVLGLALLLPLDTSKALDPLGVAFACGAATCWALYVVSARKVSGPLGNRAVAWGMLVAALIALPFGAARAGASLFEPRIVATGLVVAVLSSVMPYLIEIVAMNRLTASVVGLSLGAAPAAGALVGFLVLGERLLPIQGVAILCIIGASVGCALASSWSRQTDIDAR
ncbi:EamA family transporter [Methylobacterium oryzae]|uniref:EamA family transporter n=1 Tax=Methylobacterium oryzae TaxID=334852 RepID=UPI001F3A749B|nr:EamA family transporter [Methylobacterium oryzae]UIN36912.1 EamA family transporter [Methylobacterium oryzae]